MQDLNQTAEVQALRELNLDEIEAVSGGLSWSCSGGYSTVKGANVGCTISGSF